MDHKEALKHLQTLINVASKADDPCVVHRIFREMVGVINNAQPPQRPAAAQDGDALPPQPSSKPAACS